MSAFDTLELNTETLRELTPDELRAAVGGSNPTWTPLTVVVVGYVVQQVTQLPGRVDTSACG